MQDSTIAITPDDIVAQARSYLGVPWRHQGRTRSGLDCAGLVILIARDLKLSDYDTTGYARHAQGLNFVEHFRANMVGIAVADAHCGDVLVFADAAYPCHCGILSKRHGVAHLIHAHALRRKVIEEPYAGEWLTKVKFAFRFRGPPLANA
jgi:cell wall-associated NlpC family hydrolase